MRPGVAFLTAVLLAPLLAGCAEPGVDGDGRLAQPTDTPTEVPTRPADTEPPVDLDDPGFVLTAPWHVGDAWDYESNQSRYRRIRVVEEVDVGASKHLRLIVAEGLLGSPPRTRLDAWIDATNWTQINGTYTTGTRSITYDPPAPGLRFYRNGTFQYNETTSDEGRFVVRTNSYFAGFEPIRLAWGTVDAARIEHRILVQSERNEFDRLLTIHFVSADYANDVLTIEGEGEVFRLMAVKYGSVQRGGLAQVS